jgi:integrase
LRPSEAANLDWSDIHLDTLEIEVKARHSKTRRYRLVPIQPNLKAWLTKFPGNSSAIGYSRRKFRDAYKSAGIDEWQLDILRHSYGTYRLPILKSADALALEMGNSSQVIFRHYRRPMTEKDARAYFALAPEAHEPSHGDLATPASQPAIGEAEPDDIDDEHERACVG